MYTPLSRQHLFINNIAEETALLLCFLVQGKNAEAAGSANVLMSSLSGSSHIAVTIIRNLVLMANYSISANVFCLSQCHRKEKHKEKRREKKKRKKTYVQKRKKRKNQKKEKTFKQQHRPFLRSRKQRLDWGIVFIYICA